MIQSADLLYIGHVVIILHTICNKNTNPTYLTREVGYCNSHRSSGVTRGGRVPHPGKFGGKFWTEGENEEKGRKRETGKGEGKRG